MLSTSPSSARSIRIFTPRLLLLALALVAALTLARTAAASAAPIAHAANSGQQCPEPYPAQRDPSNPLDLPTAPGADPLNGANFFVPGPAHGAAASAIARLVGLNPQNLAVTESWASFRAQLSFGPLANKLASNRGLAYQVAELSKVASQPEAQRFSSFSGGGGPGAIFAQAEKILCRNMQADPGSIPIVNTYFLHPVLGGCPTPGQVRAYIEEELRTAPADAQAIVERLAVDFRGFAPELVASRSPAARSGTESGPS